MTRRSRMTTSQRIDLGQRRRTRGAEMYGEQPTPLDVRKYPGGGEGGSWDPGWPTDVSWLSPEIGWLDPNWSWLG